MSFESFALTALLPAAGAFLASLIVYRGLGVLALFGAGHLANCLASAVRGLLNVDASPVLGLIEPALWLTGCSVVVLLTARVAGRTWSAAKKRLPVPERHSGS